MLPFTRGTKYLVPLIPEEVKMSVVKRSWQTSSGKISSAFAVRYRDADGKQRLKTFERERDAKAWERRVKDELDKGIHRPDSTSLTLRQLRPLLLERCEAEGLEPEAVEKYESHLRLHVEPAVAALDTPNRWAGELGDVKLSRLTTPICDAFRLYLASTTAWNSRGTARTARPISRRMQGHILSTFKAVLKEAQKRGLIAYNPAISIRIASRKRHRVLVRIGVQIPDRPDVRAILAASTGMWRTLFMTDAFSGMRMSELRALLWPSIDLDNGCIEVSQRADKDGNIGSCKSAAGYRRIKIADELVAELRRWQLICPSSPLNLVFPDDDGNIMSRSAIYRSWCDIQRRIDMVRADGHAKYTFHALRHFYASIMIAANTPPKRLQELLGHATLAMTTDTYGHLFPAGADEAERINNAMAAVLAA